MAYLSFGPIMNLLAEEERCALELNKLGESIYDGMPKQLKDQFAPFKRTE